MIATIVSAIIVGIVVVGMLVFIFKKDSNHDNADIILIFLLIIGAFNECVALSCGYSKPNLTREQCVSLLETNPDGANIVLAEKFNYRCAFNNYYCRFTLDESVTPIDIGYYIDAKKGR